MEAPASMVVFSFIAPPLESIRAEKKRLGGCRVRGGISTKMQGNSCLSEDCAAQNKASRLQGFKASRLQGFKASRLQGFKASRLQGFPSEDCGRSLFFSCTRLPLTFSEVFCA
jgi:hypothetical protein